MQFVIKDLTLIAWCSLLQLDRRPHDDTKDFKTCVGMRCWQVLKIAFSEWTPLWNTRICWKWHMDLMPLGRASMNWLHPLSREAHLCSFMQAASRSAKTTTVTLPQRNQGKVEKGCSTLISCAYYSIWYPTHPRSSWLLAGEAELLVPLPATPILLYSSIE